MQDFCWGEELLVKVVYSSMHKHTHERIKTIRSKQTQEAIYT